MTKKTINISVDVAVYEKHKVRGSNISDLCNTFLANYGVDVIKIREKAIQKASNIVEAVEALQKQEAKSKELNDMLLEAGKHRANNLELSNKLLIEICEKFELSWVDAVRRMEAVR